MVDKTTIVSPKLEGQKIRSCREVNTGQSVFLFFQEAVVKRRRTGIIMRERKAARELKREYDNMELNLLDLDLFYLCLEHSQNNTLCANYYMSPVVIVIDL